MYCVTAVVKYKCGGATVLHQIPAFFLSEAIQGIISDTHAEEVARSIVNPLGKLNVSVSVVKL